MIGYFADSIGIPDGRAAELLYKEGHED